MKSSKAMLSAVVAIAALSINAAFAGHYIHVTSSAGQSFSDTVTVGAGATAHQFGTVYYTGYFNYMDNFGPLGNYTMTVGNYLNVSGPVSSGSHNIYQYVSANGYSGTEFSW